MEAAGSTFLRPPIDQMFSFCSHGAPECPDVNASQCSKKSEAETTALVEAEVAEAIEPAVEATCVRLCARL
jgi:hypothetical protein